MEQPNIIVRVINDSWIMQTKEVEIGRYNSTVLRTTRDKGLVIFNPAVEGWSTGEGCQNCLKTWFRGDEKIVYSF